MLSPNFKFGILDFYVAAFSIHAYNNYKSYQTLKFFFPKWKEVQYDSGKADVCRKPVLHLRKQLKVRGCVEFCQTLWWIQGSRTPTPPPDQCFSGSTGLFGCLSITSLPHWLFCLPDTICYICLCVSVCANCCCNHRHFLRLATRRINLEQSYLLVCLTVLNWRHSCCVVDVWCVVICKQINCFFIVQLSQSLLRVVFLFANFQQC